MTELLPCPFCGSKEVRDGSALCQCAICGASAAPTAWSRRADAARSLSEADYEAIGLEWMKANRLRSTHLYAFMAGVRARSAIDKAAKT